MEPRYFPEANKKLLKPPSMTDEECAPLWVYNNGEESISCWQLTWRERFQALLWGRIWLGVLAGRSAPPVRLWCTLTVFQTTWQHLRHGARSLLSQGTELKREVKQ